MADIRSALPRTLLACAVLLTASGCEIVGVRACTLIGCQDGLTVKFTTPVATGDVVEVTDLDAGETRSQSCQVVPSGCTSAFFADFTATRVRVVVNTGGTRLQGDFSPAYRTNRPNGRGCPPTCRVAEVTVPSTPLVGATQVSDQRDSRAVCMA